MRFSWITVLSSKLCSVLDCIERHKMLASKQPQRQLSITLLLNLLVFQFVLSIFCSIRTTCLFTVLPMDREYVNICSVYSGFKTLPLGAN